MYKRKLILSINFRDNLKEISLYISIDSKSNSINFVNLIKEKINNLILFPSLGEDLGNSNRKLIINKNYKILYKIDDKNIIILSIKNVKLNNKNNYS